MSWSLRVRIPERDEYEIETNMCPDGCPFYTCDGNWECKLGYGIDNGKYEECPGPDCPGPGWYVIVQENKR